MWLAILVTIVASASNNVGKALQKEATRQLPRFSVEPKILLQYARSREWLLGLAADLGGALLMIAAFALAPVCFPLYTNQEYCAPCLYAIMRGCCGF